MAILDDIAGGPELGKRRSQGRVDVTAGAQAFEVEAELHLCPIRGRSDGRVGVQGRRERREQRAAPQRCRHVRGVGSDGADAAAGRSVEASFAETGRERGVDACGERSVAAQALEGDQPRIAEQVGGATHGVLALKRALAEQDSVDAFGLGFGGQLEEVDGRDFEGEALLA